MNLPEALGRLRSTAEFQIIMTEAAKMRPSLFPMDPKQPLEQEAVKAMYDSGMQNGFDLLYQWLRGKHG
ncbi:MAG: hypothetical protein ACRD2L_15250 [Terriglobia bacterium]